MKATSLIVLLLNLPTVALAQTPVAPQAERGGGQEHGGGFAYEKTSSALLDVAKTELANQLLDFKDFLFTYMWRMNENGTEKSISIEFD